MNPESNAYNNRSSQRKIVTVYVKEYRKYSLDDLRLKLRFETIEEADDCIAKLMEKDIVKTVRNYKGESNDLSDLTDSDYVNADTNNSARGFSYVFKFVGVIVVGSRVLKCYPKYLLSIIEEPGCNELKQIEYELKERHDALTGAELSDEDVETLKARCDEILKIDKHLKLAVGAVRKYNRKKEQNVYQFVGGGNDNSFNLLSVLIFLMNDYFEFGLYTNTESITEINGNDEILWDRTVNETIGLIHNRRPIYTELITLKRKIDDSNYFTRLHECVLTRISRDLINSDLLKIFEFPEVNLTEDELEYFGDDDAIIYNLEKELNVQFNTRKRLVLDAMRAYIRSGSSVNFSDNLSLYGSSSFNLVWQDVCADIFDNKLGVSCLQLEEDYGVTFNGVDDRQTLSGFIDKPHWDKWGDADETLKPDIVSIDDFGRSFVILDAKYYTPGENTYGASKGLPGIESISKQYLYQLAFWPIISKFKQKNDNETENCKVYNCFLLPTEKDVVQNLGSVSMRMFSHISVNSDEHGNVAVPMEDIKVRSLPADECFNIYLHYSEKKNVTEWLRLDEEFLALS